MPFKAPEVSRCPTCDRPVYAAEEKLAGGYKFHKVCFKCSKYKNQCTVLHNQHINLILTWNIINSYVVNAHNFHWI